MTILAALAIILLTVLSGVAFLTVVLLALIYWRLRRLENQMDVVFNASVNCEEFLAGLDSNSGCTFSAN